MLKSPTNKKLENKAISKLQSIQNNESSKVIQELGGLYSKEIVRSGLWQNLLQKTEKIIHSRLVVLLCTSEYVNVVLTKINILELKNSGIKRLPKTEVVWPSVLASFIWTQLQI